MIGRIHKEKKECYCIIGTKRYSVLLDSKNELRHGDLVEIDFYTEKNIPLKIPSSKIKIKKSASGRQMPNINSSFPLHKRLKHRILDLRNPTNHFIFITRSEISIFFRKFFTERNFIEVNTPTIMGNVSEGNVERFKIDFYGKPAFLTMNRALYLRLLICADFKQIYEFGPVFVSGAHNTPYHVSEFLTFDWATMADNFILEKHIKFIDSVFENLLSYLRDATSTLYDNEFKHLNKFDQLVIPASPPIITHQDLVKIYLKKFPDDKIIADQRHIPRRVIECGTENLGEYFWVVDFPQNFKQFYCAVDEDKKTTISAELWWNKAKVASVNLSDSDIKNVKKRLKLLGLEEQNYKTYLKAIDYASSDAVMGSINLERLLMVILGLPNIKETILFPHAKRQNILEL